MALDNVLSELSNLALITYTNVGGKKARVKVIKQLNSVWYDLGLQLGQTTVELDNYINS